MKDTEYEYTMHNVKRNIVMVYLNIHKKRTFLTFCYVLKDSEKMFMTLIL